MASRGASILEMKSIQVGVGGINQVEESSFDNIFLTMAGDSEDKEKIDMSDVENGPLPEAERECRDMFCCLLFIAAIGGMVYLTYWGYENGDVAKPFRGVDEFGSICGDSTNANTKDLKYIYYYNPTDDIAKRTCVSFCPAYENSDITAPTRSTGAATSAVITYNFKYDSSGNPIAPSSGTPAASDVVGYDTSFLIGRFCIPSKAMFDNNIFDSSTFARVLNEGDLGNFFTDLQSNWEYLLIGIGISFVIAFLVMCFLRCCVGCIVWFSLFAIVFLFAGLALMFFYQAGKLGDVGGVASYAGVPGEGSDNAEVYAWICVGLSALFLLVILCCCSRIRLAVAVCKCAGQFVGSVCLIVLVPIFQALLAIAVWVACIAVMITLISAAEFVGSTEDYISSVNSYTDPALNRFYAFVFGTLWVNAFLGAMTTFVIASACVMWYYSHGPGQELSLPIARSYKMIFRYYIGPLAFGSLLIAIVQFIQLVVELFKRQAEANGGDNKCLEYVTKCIQCCLSCVECIIKFINTQAYIQIAIRGKNFCYAAKDGFELAWSNVVRFAVVGGVGTVIMFIGKVMIAAGSATAFYMLITYTSARDSYLQPFYQVLLMFIIGYGIGMLFMSVYAVAMDALLQCFLVDELNSKGKGKPKYAPEELADVMDID